MVFMPGLQQFPAIYEEPVIRLIHHSTHKLDDLAGRIAAHFRDSFVCGEEVVGTKDGTPMACRVIAVHEAPAVEGAAHATFLQLCFAFAVPYFASAVFCCAEVCLLCISCTLL